MIRYHVVGMGKSINVHGHNLSKTHADKLKQLLKRQHPQTTFKAVPVDIWNQIITVLNRF